MSWETRRARVGRPRGNGSRHTLYRGVFLCGAAAIRRLDGNTHLVHRSETDRQPVYDIQRAHEDARTPAHGRHIRGVSKPLEKRLRSTRKVAYGF